MESDVFWGFCVHIYFFYFIFIWHIYSPSNLKQTNQPPTHTTQALAAAVSEQKWKRLAEGLRSALKSAQAKLAQSTVVLDPVVEVRVGLYTYM